LSGRYQKRMAARRFHSRTVRRRFPFWASVLAAILILAGTYELYSAIVPSQSFNPLWREVTVGQRVIGDWMYGGQDEEGYLKFYSHGETLLMPPSARVLDLDGRFVILEGHTVSTLTFAYPLAAIPITWLLGMLTAFGLTVYLLYRRARGLRRRRWRPARTSGVRGGFRSRSAATRLDDGLSARAAGIRSFGTRPSPRFRATGGSILRRPGGRLVLARWPWPRLSWRRRQRQFRARRPRSRR
jgi:hypothetical protein